MQRLCRALLYLVLLIFDGKRLLAALPGVIRVLRSSKRLSNLTQTLHAFCCCCESAPLSQSVHVSSNNFDVSALYLSHLAV
jgi:hypothetical protein